MLNAHQWRVLSRPECSLCETMLHDLITLAGDRFAAGVEIVDISTDPELEHKYGRRIPVLLIDGEFVCEYRLDVDRVKPYLDDID